MTHIFGERFAFASFGESHGMGIGCVIFGVPAGLKINENLLLQDLARRKGHKNFSTKRRENDTPEILSGIFRGKSTGAPIGVFFKNSDTKSADYQNLEGIFRPSHADFTYFHKFLNHDFFGGGRASARESVARVCAGAFAKMILHELQIFTDSGISGVGEILARENDFDFAKNSEIFALDPKAEMAQKNAIKSARATKDSIGGTAKIRVRGEIPIGLGEVLYDKIDAKISAALMGVNGVKAVEIGSGVKAAKIFGSQNNDQMDERGFLSNHAGGVLGGLTTGAQILITAHFKPTPSIAREQSTQNLRGKAVKIKIFGRHDPCIAVRGAIVCEAMVACAVCDALLQNLGAKMSDLHKIYQNL